MQAAKVWLVGREEESRERERASYARTATGFVLAGAWAPRVSEIPARHGGFVGARVSASWWKFSRGR
jgi:hypothetical protein